MVLIVSVETSIQRTRLHGGTLARLVKFSEDERRGNYSTGESDRASGGVQRRRIRHRDHSAGAGDQGTHPRRRFRIDAGGPLVEHTEPVAELLRACDQLLFGTHHVGAPPHGFSVDAPRRYAASLCKWTAAF